MKTVFLAFDNPHQHGLDKIVKTYGWNNTNTQYRPSRPGNVAPLIHEEYIGDDGNIWCILANGNHQRKDLYNSMWCIKTLK